MEVGDLPVSKQFYHKDDLVFFGNPRPAGSSPLYLSSYDLVESQAAELPRSVHYMNKHYPEGALVRTENSKEDLPKSHRAGALRFK